MRRGQNQWAHKTPRNNLQAGQDLENRQPSTQTLRQ